MRKSFKWFAVLTTIGMLLILLGGALVTKTNSGMGCGRSWPLCNDELIPSKITIELVIELAHRLVSGIVGIMVLILSIWSWRSIGHIRETKFLSFLSVFSYPSRLDWSGSCYMGSIRFCTCPSFWHISYLICSSISVNLADLRGRL